MSEVGLGWRVDGETRFYRAPKQSLSLFQDIGMLFEKPSSKKIDKILQSVDAELFDFVAPLGYGILFVDFDSKTLWSNQSYLSVSSASVDSFRDDAPGLVGGSRAESVRRAFEHGAAVDFALRDSTGTANLWRRVALSDFGVDSYEKIIEKTSDEESPLRSGRLVFSPPGWTLVEDSDLLERRDASFSSIARDMVELDIVSAKDAAAWDCYLRNLEEFDRRGWKPGLVDELLAEKEARQLFKCLDSSFFSGRRRYL